MILLDTNILVRLTNPTDPSYSTVLQALQALHSSEEELGIVPQNLYEFWAVATRPLTGNGLGLEPSTCSAQIARFQQLFRFLPDAPSLFHEWESLVRAYQCQGRVAYDARLIAAMKNHGVTRILTFNGGDFTRYPGIEILDPTSYGTSSHSTYR